MIEPKRDIIIVKLPKEQEQTLSGLWIPAVAREPAPEAMIVSAGPKALKWMELEGIKIGDRILFEQYAGLEVTDKDWGEVVLIDPKDVKGVFYD